MTKSSALAMRTTWGGRRIDYLLTLEPRRDLVITVHTDLRVAVLAPISRPVNEILERVEARRAWIARQLREFEALPVVPPMRFVSGESLLYLGRQYRLRVSEGESAVALQLGQIHVRMRQNRNQSAVKLVLRKWYGERARLVFEKRLARLQRELSDLAGVVNQLRIRRMTRRWGSCTSRGVITLNPDLVQAPPSCIDYVLTHELIHLLEPGHTPRFYRLLSRVMPDWPHRRRRLSAFPTRHH